MDLNERDYVVTLQCHIVKERCSGYGCEQAFTQRAGGFADYPAEKSYRTLQMTCGGCCGRATLRKLGNLVQQIAKREKIERDRIVVQLSSCMTKSNFHGPPCPHLDYIKTIIGRLNLDMRDDTVVTSISEKRRAEGRYEDPLLAKGE